MLQTLAEHLKEHGKTLPNYGLPTIEQQSTEVEHEIHRWAAQSNHMRQRAEESIVQFNEDQQIIFQNILDNIHSQNPSPIFIDGKAGCGKTMLINTICDVLRSQNQIVLATATSAFMAQLYAGGKTTHSTFKVTIHFSHS